jgi:hypothetical protein
MMTQKKQKKTKKMQSFNIPNTKQYMKEGHFSENTNMGICRSDHRRVYVFELTTSEKKQTLRHGSSKAPSHSHMQNLTPSQEIVLFK